MDQEEKQSIRDRVVTQYVRLYADGGIIDISTAVGISIEFHHSLNKLINDQGKFVY